MKLRILNELHEIDLRNGDEWRVRVELTSSCMVGGIVIGKVAEGRLDKGQLPASIQMNINPGDPSTEVVCSHFFKVNLADGHGGLHF